MTPAEKRQRTSLSESTPSTSVPQQQQQQHQHPPPMVALPPPLVPYHPHMIPMMPYPVYHPHAPHPHPHPHYYISMASPNSTPQPSPSQVLETATGHSPSIVATESPPSGSSPRYERILPKRSSESAPGAPVVAGSPSSSPLGPHSSTYAYSLQPSPLSLPHAPPYGQHLPQHSTADQREQARKTSHSAIERRRRERINDKIMQLKKLIPACADQENLHKMSILQSAIDYIHYLKGMVDEKQQEQPQPPKQQPQLADENESGTQLSSSSPPPSQPTVSINARTFSSTSIPTSSLTLAPTLDHDPPPTPTTPSYGDHSPPTSSTSALEPLKPIDIMNSNRQSPYHSSPSFSLVSPTSLEKNSHMKLDHLLS